MSDRFVDNLPSLSQKLEILEISDNPQLSMNNFFKIKELLLLKKLNVSMTKVKNEGLRSFLNSAPNKLRKLEFLNMDSCNFLDKETIVLLILFKLPRLRYLNMGHNLNFEESDIWKLVFCLETLVELEVEGHLLGEQVKNQLALNRIYAEQELNK